MDDRRSAFAEDPEQEQEEEKSPQRPGMDISYLEPQGEYM